MAYIGASLQRQLLSGMSLSTDYLIDSAISVNQQAVELRERINSGELRLTKRRKRGNRGQHRHKKTT